MPREREGYSLWFSTAILLLVVGLYGFLHSPFFKVQYIQVNGSSYTPEQLAEIAGIEKGTSLLGLDVDLAVKRLEQEPIISRAVIYRYLPDTVYIQVEERSPIAMVPSELGFCGVAADGTVLGRVEGAAVNLPVITGVDKNSILVGKKNVSELVIAAGILRELPRAVRDLVSEVNVVDRDCLKIISGSLVEYHLGGPGNLKEKLDVVATLLPRLDSVSSQAYTIVDVSNPKRPVVRKLP
ncbi:MAG TPA: FtsQ-type POTRA domain-containing protein [Firmicutes bacterium]|nr:FtsQ-type POTRA domain-containing protein [Bacillota bacterium]